MVIIVVVVIDIKDIILSYLIGRDYSGFCRFCHPKYDELCKKSVIIFCDVSLNRPRRGLKPPAILRSRLKAA
jgi:hypothetical protein